MELIDEYKSISATSNGIYKEKGSKFLAFAEPAETEDQAKAVLEKYRKQYHDARHHCFAWAIGPHRELQRMNDDGEPSGTAGKPIFGQILSFGITNVVIIVVRYFGGTRLGTSGLITAYKTVARQALEKASFCTKTINDIFEVVFDYPETSEVMKIIQNVDIIKSHYTDACKLVISVRRNNSTSLTNNLRIIKNLTISYLETR
jgi:uncharacterized YigZ family protein